MTIVKILVFFLISLGLSTQLSNIENKTWTTEEIIKQINEEVGSQDSFFYDPYDLYKVYKDKVLEEYYKYITTEYNKHLFIIVLNNISMSDLKPKDILDNYNYKSSDMKKDSIFVIHGYDMSTFNFTYGDNINLTEKYIEDLTEEVKKGSQYPMDLFRNIIIGLRNGMIIPDGYWTPADLATLYINKYPSEQYKFFDPLLTVDSNVETQLQDKFLDGINEDVHIYLFIVTRISESYMNNTEGFINELASSLKSNINLTNSEIGLYVIWDKLFNLKIGDDLGGNFTEYDYTNFMNAVCFWESLSTAYERFMDESRYCVVGNRRGFTGKFFAKLMNESSIYHGDHGYFHYFPKDEEKENKKIVDGIIKNFYKDLNFNSLVIYLEKLYNGQSLQAFYDEFFSNYQFKTPNLTKNNTLFMLMINDRSSYDLIVGNEVSSLLPKENITHAKSKGESYVKSGQYLQAFREILKWVRFDIMESKSLYIGKNLAYYFNDFLEKKDYYFYQQTVSIQQSEIDSNLNKYYEAMITDKTHLFIITMDKIDPIYNQNLTKFGLEFLETISDSDGIYHDFSRRFILIFFDKEQKLFEITRGSTYSTALSDEKIKALLNHVQPVDEINSYKFLTKYIYLYAFILTNDWTADRIVEYLTEFDKKERNYLLFNANNYFKIEHEENLNAYLKDINDKNIHLFVLPLKMKGEIEVDSILKELIEKFPYPQGVSKDNSLFIIDYYGNDEYQNIYYNNGESVKGYITNNEIDDIIRKHYDEYSNFDSYRNILLEIKLKITGKNTWNGDNLAEFYNNKYPINLDNYDIFDYYIALKDKEITEIKEKLNKLVENYMANIFIFVINSMESTTTLEEISDKLLININDLHVRDRKNTIIISVSSEEIKFFIKRGELIKYSFTDYYLKIVTDNAETKKTCKEKINSILDQLISEDKLKRKFTIEELINAYKEKEGDTEFLFEPNSNFNKEQTDIITDLHFKNTKKYRYTFTFIMSEYDSIEYKSSSDYVEKLAKNFPVPSAIKKNSQVYLVYFSSTKDLNYFVKNNNNLNKKVSSIVTDSKKYFDNSVYEGIHYALEKLEEIPQEEKTKFPWMALSLILFVVVIICVIIILLMRNFKKKNQHSDDVESTEHIKPIENIN